MIHYSRGPGGSVDLSPIERQIAELKAAVDAKRKQPVSHAIAGFAAGGVGATIVELIHRVFF